MSRHIRLWFAGLAGVALLMVGLMGLARADFATPFLEGAGSNVGAISNTHAYVSLIGKDKYLVVVRSDTEEYFAIPAQAQNGIVDQKLLGREVEIQGKVLKNTPRPGRTPRVEIEILSAKKLPGD